MHDHPPLCPMPSVDVGCKDGGEPALLDRHNNVLPNHVHRQIVPIDQDHPLHFYPAGQLLPED